MQLIRILEGEIIGQASFIREVDFDIFSLETYGHINIETC